jgi:hypothetical protein
MQVASYVFQSPYPQPVQYGRPDPVAEAQQQQSENSEALGTTPNATQQEAESYQYTATSKTGSSVNVAASSGDTGVSSSLEAFSSANSQAQAVTAYSA